MLRLLLFLFLPLAAQATSVHELAQSKRWLRLLHYKTHWFTGYHSTISRSGFFLSPDGRRDPEKEMLATIEAFQTRPNETISKLPQPLACAFPARFRFLNQELHLGLSFPKCDRWEEFLTRFHGHDSLTLVFSTAYPNNPASMFGHSFLRVNAKAESGKAKLDLLDTGLSYAAQVPDDENNFLFVWFGLTGGYVGTFSAIPYYAKVAEYNSSESRDLWEYDLNFDADDTWWVIANAWEVEVNGLSDYYFFDENCSYEILSLLEVAKPDWNVAEYLFHRIPGETVKSVTSTPGAIKSVKFRPSLFKKLLAYGDRLGKDERTSFFRVLEGEGIERATVPTLDTAAQYFYYLKQQKSGKLPEREEGIFQKVLRARASRLEPSPPEPIYDESSRPEWGHHASRFSLGGGSERGSGSKNGAFEEFGIKFAYHDLLNHDVGFVPFSEISFPHFTFRYFNDEQRFYVQRIEILNINSFSPWSWIKNAISWRVNLAYEVPADLCTFCHVLHGEGNVGASESIAKDRVRAYQLLGLYGDTGTPLARRWRVGPKLTLGLLANVTKNWKQQWEVAGSSDPWNLGSGQTFFVSALWGQSYFLSQEWELRAIGRATWRTKDNAQSRGEAVGQVLYYF
jgi:Domain of unknown function (DUF4105)